MVRRRTLYVSLSILGLFLLGTVIVLSSVSYYLSIDSSAYIQETDLPSLDNVTRWNASDHGETERIPRILHQTWKTETLPLRWQDISRGCRDMMPDYEYMLWTDASSREFIAEQYPWFLDTFDNYTYPIQRADAIRYFVLHHYGGVYLDLDVGCLRPLDPLLVYSVILPKTIPVGVSNDLMFAEKGHPFLAQTIHNLVTFDHSWVLNYPTVMFSTGPMFLSAQYGLYTASHPAGEVRVLPKALYGKNAKEGEAPHSFFSHFYGSSWHADDAAFIGFLGKWGKVLMWVGLAVLIVGLVRLALPGGKQRKYSLRRIGNYDVLLPRWTQRNGRWHLDLGWLSLPGTSTQPPSPVLPDAESSIEAMSLLPMGPFDMRPSSPAQSDVSSMDIPIAQSRLSHPLFDAVRRARNRAVASFTGSHEPPEETPRTPIRSRRPRSRGVLFFLPAIFTQNQEIELPSHRPTPILSRSTPVPSQLPPEKQRYADELNRAGLYPDVFSDSYSADHQRHRSSSSQARSRSQDPSRNPSPSPTLIDVTSPQDNAV